MLHYVLAGVAAGLLLAATPFASAFAADQGEAIGDLSKAVTTPSGLKYIEHKVGTGTAAAPGASVVVHYTGWLFENGAKGTKFDSSYDRHEPLTFGLGRGQVIAGWDEGLTGMKPGGRRTLIIPPDLGYGASGAGGGVIPANATLVFDVELVAVK